MWPSPREGLYIHSDSAMHTEAQNAFDVAAAREGRIDDLNIDEVFGGGNQMLAQDEIRQLPGRVHYAYKEATAALEGLRADPTNEQIELQIESFNDLIRSNNSVDGLDDKNMWTIPISSFKLYYTLALGNYRILDDDPQEQSAVNGITRTKGLIDAKIEKSHFPKEWTIKSAEEYLGTRAAAVRVGDANASAGAGAQSGDSEGKSSTSEPRARRVDCPWPTGWARDEAAIVDMQRRDNDQQVCLEVTEPDDRVVCKLKPGSEVGFSSVTPSGGEKGWENPADDQSLWTSKNRDDFEEFVTVAERRSLYGNTRDPNADCCVRFRSRGIQMLTVSSFRKVLGKKDADAQIEEICSRDGILPPWRIPKAKERGQGCRRGASGSQLSPARLLEQGNLPSGALSDQIRQVSRPRPSIRPFASLLSVVAPWHKKAS